jgi:hypothetical protein
MMNLKAGLRLRGVNCATEVIVVKPPASEVELTCCGQEMQVSSQDARPVVPDAGEDATKVALGKRYSNEALGLELLCIKAGNGPLAVNGELLTLKDAKPLPSSD